MRLSRLFAGLLIIALIAFGLLYLDQHGYLKRAVTPDSGYLRVDETTTPPIAAPYPTPSPVPETTATSAGHDGARSAGRRHHDPHADGHKDCLHRCAGQSLLAHGGGGGSQAACAARSHRSSQLASAAILERGPDAGAAIRGIRLRRLQPNPHRPQRAAVARAALRNAH